MSGKRTTLIVSVIFYIIMIIFTVSARKIHNESLPRVTVESLAYEAFAEEEAAVDVKSEADEKSELNKTPMNYEWNVGILKELYDNQKVYIISKEIMNGEERSIAKEVTNLVIGRSNDTSYEVLSGLSVLDQVIITGQELIQDGREVYVED